MAVSYSPVSFILKLRKVARELSFEKCNKIAMNFSANKAFHPDPAFFARSDILIRKAHFTKLTDWTLVLKHGIHQINQC